MLRGNTAFPAKTRILLSLHPQGREPEIQNREPTDSLLSKGGRVTGYVYVKAGNLRLKCNVSARQ